MHHLKSNLHEFFFCILTNLEHWTPLRISSGATSQVMVGLAKASAAASHDSNRTKALDWSLMFLMSPSDDLADTEPPSIIVRLGNGCREMHHNEHIYPRLANPWVSNGKRV